MMNSILAVVTPSQTHDLTSIERIKSELNITDSSQDDLLAAQIAEASETFADLCNRVFASETVTETFNNWRRHSTAHFWRDPEPLELARYPVTAISSVVEDGTTIDPSLYEVDGATGLLYRLNDQDATVRCSWFARRIVVGYTGGYVLLTTLPRTIEAAVITLVRGRWFGSRRDPSLKSEAIDQVATLQYWTASSSSSGLSSLPPDVCDAVDLYRRNPGF